MEYSVQVVRDVSDDDGAEEMITRVEHMLKMGWEVCGGISIANNENTVVFAQAMIKRP